MKAARILAILLTALSLLATTIWAEPPQHVTQPRVKSRKPALSVPANASKPTAAKRRPSPSTRAQPSPMAGSPDEPAALSPKLNPTTRRRKLGDVGARNAAIPPRFQQFEATVRGTSAKLRIVTDRPTEVIFAAGLTPVLRDDVERGLRDFRWSTAIPGFGPRHDFHLDHLPPGTTIHWLALAKDRHGLSAAHAESFRTATRNVRVTVETVGGNEAFWKWDRDGWRAKWKLSVGEVGDTYECAESMSDVGPGEAEDFCIPTDLLPRKPFAFALRDVRPDVLELRMTTRVRFEGDIVTSELAKVKVELPGNRERASIPFVVKSPFAYDREAFVRGNVEIWHGDGGP